VKIISHFFLAMPASLTAIRDSGDSKRGNFLEKSFRSVIKSGDPRPGKQREGTPGGTYQEINPRDKPKRETQGERSREGMDREGMKGKELTGINTMGTYPLALLNIRNNPLGASLAGIADRLPC
jgi:hypothetical protein